MTDLTVAEWQVLSCLWKKKKSTGKEICAALEKSVGWSRSTTLTMLRRMEKKGLIKVDDSEKIQRFSAAVRQESATLQETRKFIDRVYQGSIGLMMSTLTEKQSLSDEEIASLQEILNKARRDAR